jgi:hypothetical protein
MQNKKTTSDNTSTLNNNGADGFPEIEFWEEFKNAAKVGVLCAFTFFFVSMAIHVIKRLWASYQAQMKTGMDMDKTRSGTSFNEVDVEAATEEGI